MRKNIRFSGRWIQMIVTWIITIFYSVLINGKPRGIINPSRSRTPSIESFIILFIYFACNRVNLYPRVSGARKNNQGNMKEGHQSHPCSNNTYNTCLLGEFITFFNVDLSITTTYVLYPCPNKHKIML